MNTGSLLCLLLFFTACVVVLVRPRVYHWIVLIGVLFLACVFIEPSPSDLIFAAALSIGLITGAYRPRLQGKALTAALVLFASFAVSFPAVLLAKNQIASLRYFTVTFFLFLIMLFVCTYAAGDRMNSILRAYIAAAFLSFVAGLLGYLGFFPDILMADEFRVKGLFKDPNVYGPFFVPAILLLIADVKRKTLLHLSAFIHWLLIMLLTLGVIFSYSRAAWINLAVSVFVYFLLNLGTLRSDQLLRVLSAGVLIPVIIAGLLLSPLFSDTGIPEFLQERAQLQEYDRERFNAQQGGLELVARNPFGYGPGQFEAEIDQATQFKMDAHSLYVRMAVENGIPSFLLFFGALIFLMWELLRRRPASSPVMIPASAALAILCGLLVNGIVVDTIHWRHFWFFIGIALCRLREEQ